MRDATRYSCIACRPTVIPSVGSRDFLVAVYARCEFRMMSLEQICRKECHVQRASACRGKYLGPNRTSKSKTVT